MNFRICEVFIGTDGTLIKFETFDWFKYLFGGLEEIHSLDIQWKIKYASFPFKQHFLAPYSKIFQLITDFYLEHSISEQEIQIIRE